LPRIHAQSGTETAVLEHPLAMHLMHFFFCHLISPSASTFTLPLDSTTGTRQPRTNHFPSHSHSLLLSPFHPICFPFPCTLGNNNRLSAAAARHLYAPEHSSIDFSSLSLTFSLFSFYNFSECSAQRLCIYLPIPNADPLTNGYNYQSVGTHVFKLPPHRGWH